MTASKELTLILHDCILGLIWKIEVSQQVNRIRKCDQSGTFWHQSDTTLCPCPQSICQIQNCLCRMWNYHRRTDRDFMWINATLFIHVSLEIALELAAGSRSRIKSDTILCLVKFKQAGLIRHIQFWIIVAFCLIHLQI